MSVIYTSGSIFECDAEAIINPVNCVGVSGADSPSSSPCVIRRTTGSTDRRAPRDGSSPGGD